MLARFGPGGQRVRDALRAGELQRQIGPLNVFRYITFRTGRHHGRPLCSCSCSAGHHDLRASSRARVSIREDGPRTHFSKKGTPTMGGS